MKLCGVLLAVVATAFAVPEAPYPPSGWKPAGQQFNLPQKAYNAPPNNYGLPDDASTDVPPQNPDSEPASNNSRIVLLTTNTPTSAQFNQGSSQFFFIAPEVPQNAPLVQRTSNREDFGVRGTQLGQLVQLPVASSQLKQAPRPVQRTGVFESARLVSSQANQFQTPASPVPTPVFALRTSARLETAPAPVENTPSALILTPEGRFQQVPLQQAAATVVTPSQSENGQYYLALPSGKLQQVQYMTGLSADNRLTSNVEYNEVQPIRGPVYSFGSPLVRVL